MGIVADHGMRESFESNNSDPNPSQHEYVLGKMKTGDGAMVVYLAYTIYIGIIVSAHRLPKITLLTL